MESAYGTRHKRATRATRVMGDMATRECEEVMILTEANARGEEIFGTVCDSALLFAQPVDCKLVEGQKTRRNGRGAKNRKGPMCLVYCITHLSSTIRRVIGICVRANRDAD